LLPNGDVLLVGGFGNAWLTSAELYSDYNQITGQLLVGGDMQLSYLGISGTNYALERTFDFTPPNWIPLATNPAGAGGALLFTNTPVANTNNFWRIRSVP